MREATPDELTYALAHALRFDGRKRVRYADDSMARIAAAHLVEYLRQSGFVVMKKPPLQGHGDPRFPPTKEGDGG